MEVEDVTGVGLAARRAAQQQRHRPVGLGLLGEVVEHDEDMLALVHPVLADGRARVRRDVLEACGVGCRAVHDRRVLEGAGALQRAAHLGDRRALLADRHVDAAHLLLRVARLPVAALVDDGVERDRGLAGLAVADDELALAAPDGGHCVDRLDAGLERLVDALPVHDAGGLELEVATLGEAGDLAQAVDRLAHRVHDAAEVAVTHGDGEDLARTLDGRAFLDAFGVAEHDDADLANIEVQSDPADAVLELQQLVRHRRGQTLDARDAVTRGEDRSDLLAGGCGRVEVRDELLQCRPDLVRVDRQFRHEWLPSFVTRADAWPLRSAQPSIRR